MLTPTTDNQFWFRKKLGTALKMLDADLTLTLEY